MPNVSRIKIIFWLVVALAVAFGIVATASAMTNISSTVNEQFAWNDVVGYIDFYSPGTAMVWGTGMDGYASSSIGPISLDCATSPSGNICGTSNYRVCNGSWSTSTGCTADAVGTLSGYAWNDNVGWISFNCYNHGNCAASTYNVIIDSSGNFSGYAWNDTIGWISFASSSVPYKVKTSWTSTSSVGTLDSATVDTLSTGGSVLNSITWYGSASANGTGAATYVGFQVAASNCSNGATNAPSCNTGTWSFTGPGGLSTNAYDTPCSVSGFQGNYLGLSSPASQTQGKPICIDPAQVSGYRYLKYRVQLRSNLLQTETPRIDRIILNWSK